MQTLLSGAKSYIPKLNLGYINRQSLIEKIHSGIDKKLTIISTPAGFGKTSLLTKWSENIKDSISWSTLDKSDNNISFFFSYLIDSLSKIKSGFGLTVQNAINSSQNFDADFIANVFVNEINEFFNKCIIIFDDFQCIENPQIIEFINNILIKSSNLHIIISSRKNPDINLSKLRLNDLINEIKAEDLRFSKEEQKEFFAKNISANISENQLNKIDNKIEGWIAGMQFSALLMKNKLPGNFIDELPINENFIEDYLVEEVFFNQEDYLKDFLLKTSILKYFNNDLANHLLSINNSDQIIQKIKNENLFIMPLDNQQNSNEWYRYHNIFKNLLNKKFKVINEVNIKELHIRAIEWFAKNNLIIEALSHCLESKEYDKYCSLLSKISIDMVMKGELQGFISLTENIPEAIIINYPIICLCLGWVNCLTHNLEMVEKYIEYAENPEIDLTEDKFPNREIHTELLRAYYYTLYFKADSSYFRKCIDIILKLKKEVKDNALKSSIERILAGLYMVVEEWDLSIESFLSARNIGKLAKNHLVWLTSSANYALLLIFSGEFQKAKKICDDTISEVNSQFNNSFPLLGYIYHPLGKILYEENHVDQAINYLEKSISLAEKIGNKFLQITCLLELAVIYAYEKNLRKSLEILNKAEMIIDQTPIYKDIFIEFNLLKLWDIHKKTDNISNFIDKYLVERQSKNYVNEYKEFIYAKILLQQNNSKEAENILKKLINQKEEIFLDEFQNENTRIKNRFFYLEILLLTAFVYRKNNNINKSVETLKKAIVYAEEKGYLKTFMNQCKLFSDIIDLIIREGNESLNSYLFKVIKKEDNQNKLFNNVLSEREIEILKFLSIGLSNQDIAEKLILAVGTVKKHTNSIYSKLNVNNRVSAIQKANELGII